MAPSLGQRGSGGQQGGGRVGGRAKGGGRGGVGKGGGGQTKPVPSKPKLIFGGFEPVGEGRGLRFPGGKISSATNDIQLPAININLQHTFREETREI